MGDEGSAAMAACSSGCSEELAKSSLRMLMGETVSSQLVMPKSRRWALAWLESPARVSKPAPQNSHRIRLNVLGSKLATAERRGERQRRRQHRGSDLRHNRASPYIPNSRREEKTPPIKARK